MRKLLLAALISLAPAAAFADTWAPAACANGLSTANPRCTYSFVNADGSTPTTPIQNSCRALAIEFLPATGGGGTVQGCADGSCADPRTIATLTSSMFPGPYVSGAPMIRVNRTAPSSGTAAVMLRCGDNLALGQVPTTRVTGELADLATNCAIENDSTPIPDACVGNGTDDTGGGGLPVVDTTSIAEGSGDATKEVRFEVDGIATGTVRVLTMPNADVNLGALDATNLAAGSLTAVDAAADLATQAELDAKSAASSTDNAVARFDSTSGDLQNSGVTIDDSNNMDGIGTLDADGAVTAPSFTADRSSTPTLALRDLETTDAEDNVRLFGNCTVTGTGAEDCDVTIDQYVDGVAKNVLGSVADGALTIGSDQTTSIATSIAVTDASVNGANESDEVTGLTDGQISDTLTASTSTTAAANDNDTSIATTAFVQQEIDDGDLLTDNCVLENDATPIPDSCVGNGTDDTGAGGGDAVRVEDGDNAGTFTAMSDMDMDDSGDINFARAAGPPDVLTATVRADAVALGTDTTNNYVASVATTAPLSGGAAGSEGTAISLTTSMATSRIIGRTTGGSGVMEELTAGAGLTLAAGNLGRAALTGEVTASDDSNATTIADAVTVDDWTLTDADVLTARTRLGVVSDTPGTNQNNYSPTGWDGTHPSKATVIRCDPSATILITGIAGGAAGRLLWLQNVTDPGGADARLIILPHESASSTAANRFAFPTRRVWFLMPGETVAFVYDGSDSRWRPLERLGWHELFENYSDLAGGSAAIAGVPTTNGTGASCQASTFLLGNATYVPTASFECDTGTTGTGSAAVAGAGNQTNIVPEQGSLVFLSRVGINALSTAATQDFELAVGFHDASGAVGAFNATDGVYWNYDVDTTTVWRACAEDAGTQNCQSIGPTVTANVYDWLGIFINGDWTRVDFFYSQNGDAWTVAGSETSDTNIPDAAETTNFVPLSIFKETGTTQSNSYLDLVGWSYNQIRGS